MLIADIVANIHDNPPQFNVPKARKKRTVHGAAEKAKEKALLAALKENPNLFQQLFADT